MELVDLIPIVAISGVGGWFGNAVLQWMRSRDTRHANTLSNEAKLEEHRDALTFDLLRAARTELAELRNEVNRLKPLEAHLIHFDEALQHMEALLLADDDKALKTAKRNAKAFLNRIQRLQEATGTLRNEVQRLTSKINVIERDEDSRYRDATGPKDEREKGNGNTP